MDIIIKELEFDYVNEVAKISKDSFPKAEQWDISSLKGELFKHISHNFVATINDTVVGFIGMWIIAGEAQINTIAIDSNYRNQGIGTKLLKHSIDYCKEVNAYEMNLEVRESNEAAKKLYLNLGFTLVGERKKYYSNNGETALLLKLEF
ncbi:MAG: ribosomal protein S18-alanine N-acetyltransferase [Sarcina sp.]